jgi:hypothetical protein
MPYRIRPLTVQIGKHPEYEKLTDGTKLALRMAYDYPSKTNNGFLRTVWKALYLNENRAGYFVEEHAVVS